MSKKVISELERLSKLIHKAVLLTIRKPLIADANLKERISYSIDDIGLKLRPYLAIKGAQLGGLKESKIITTATAIEFLQLSTLVIDDILDESLRRNNKQSCFKKFGDKESILIGDYLRNISYDLIFSQKKSFSEKKMFSTITYLEEAYQSITIGQFNDLQSSHLPIMSEQKYFKLIELTTGIFIRNSLLIGASLSDLPPEQILQLKKYGHYLGIAYQLRDDILDIIGEEKFTGKEPLIDIKNKRYRLPVIYLLTKGNENHKKHFQKIAKKKTITHKDEDNLALILNESYAIKYSVNKAKLLCEKAKKGITTFPESEIKQELIELADIISSFEN
ncbi:MAG: polyprenyl synthetase family protein [Methylococcaceae bacterium]